MHFEGPQNMNQMGSPFIEKEKFAHPYFKIIELNTIILIILTIIIAPRQVCSHPMQLDLHSSAFKISNLSICYDAEWLE